MARKKETGADVLVDCVPSELREEVFVFSFNFGRVVDDQKLTKCRTLDRGNGFSFQLSKNPPSQKLTGQGATPSAKMKVTKRLLQ